MLPDYRDVLGGRDVIPRRPRAADERKSEDHAAPPRTLDEYSEESSLIPEKSRNRLPRQNQFGGVRRLPGDQEAAIPATPLWAVSA